LQPIAQITFRWLLFLVKHERALSPPTLSLLLACPQPKVEGPYGVSPTYRSKAAVLLIAGGVGVTPLMGFFRHMYLEALASAPRWGAYSAEKNQPVY